LNNLRISQKAFAATCILLKRDIVLLRTTATTTRINNEISIVKSLCLFGVDAAEELMEYLEPLNVRSNNYQSHFDERYLSETGQSYEMAFLSVGWSRNFIL
jgi:hypothetical protein